MKRALLAGIIAATLSGGFAYANTTAQGVQVPTLSEHQALRADLVALEARVAALESAPPSTTTSTTTLPPPTTTTTTVSPTTTTTTIPSGQILPLDGIVPCDNCLLQGKEGHAYPRIDGNGRQGVTVVDVIVDGTQDPGGPLQSGTVNFRNASDIVLTNITVTDSPRSCFSFEGSSNVTLQASVCAGAQHLGVHAGGGIADIFILNNDISDFSRRNVDIGWESGGMKLTNGTNVQVIGNYVHDGNGPGIWLDIYANDSVIRDNSVSNVSAEGIFVEISSNVDVENNIIDRAPNAVTSSRMNWCYGAGILVSTADDIRVTNNTVTNSVHGILVIDQSWRGDTPPGYDASAYLIQGNSVQNVNKVGACQDVGRPLVYGGTWTDNTFVNVQSFLPPLA